MMEQNSPNFLNLWQLLLIFQFILIPVQLSDFSYSQLKFGVTMNNKLIMRNFFQIKNKNFIQYYTIPIRAISL